jgi:hypothetical protein
MQKMLTRECMQHVVNMGKNDVEKYHKQGETCVAQECAGEEGKLGIHCPDEMCIIDYIIRTEGADWVRENIEPNTITLAVFENDSGHHPINLNLRAFQTDMFHDLDKFFVRKVVSASHVPPQFPLTRKKGR